MHQQCGWDGSPLVYTSAFLFLQWASSLYLPHGAVGGLNDTTDDGLGHSASFTARCRCERDRKELGRWLLATASLIQPQEEGSRGWCGFGKEAVDSSSP